MAKIQTIKNKENITVYPQTHTQAVYDANGKKLQEWMNEYLTAEDETEIEDANTFFEIQGNKTTVLDNNSTNTQYPAAKTVYDFVTQSIGEAIGLKIEVVDLLPDTGENSTIYLIPSEDSEEQNVYNEYLYLNDKWELIGTTQVDLSNYYTKTEADGQFAKLSLYGDTTINVGRKANTTIGEYSVAEGLNTTASGTYSHAEGYNTTASGDFSSHAEGYNTTASGQHSHAEGINTTASGNYSHAEGYGTTAKLGSHAEGYGTTAKNDFSHAEGDRTTASGYTSHAEGSITTASGSCSHAEGYKTEASGTYSHAEGNATIANGQAGHAEGYHTISEFMSQHVQGEYNIADPGSGTDVRGTYAHIVGNGAGDIYRSNAHTLDWYGNAWFEGDVYVGSTSGTNKDEGSKKLATEEYINNKITYGTTTLEDGVSELATGTLYVVYEE